MPDSQSCLALTPCAREKRAPTLTFWQTVARTFGQALGSRPLLKRECVQVVSSSLMGSLAKGLFLRKVCGNSVQLSQKYVLLRHERVRKFCVKFVEVSRKFAESFCNDPFPNSPISELLRWVGRWRRGAGKLVRLRGFVVYASEV